MGVAMSSVRAGSDMKLEVESIADDDCKTGACGFAARQTQQLYVSPARLNPRHPLLLLSSAYS